MRYVLYADRWQWTADQVDEIPLWLDQWYLPVAHLLDELRAEKQKQQSTSKRIFRRR